MVNKLKKLERERTRLRKSQHTQVVDERRAKKLTMTRTKYWKLKQKGGVVSETISEVKEKKPEKKEKRERKKKEKEPELEVVEEELEDIEDEFDDLYTYDEDIEEEDV